MRHTTRLVLASLPLLVVACGQGPAATFVSTFDEIAEDVCDCYEVAGFPTRQSCIDEVTPEVFDEDQVECIDERYGEVASEADPTFNCQLRAARSVRDCIQPHRSMCNLAGFQSCFETLQVSIEACPEFPESVAIHFASCF